MKDLTNIQKMAFDAVNKKDEKVDFNEALRLKILEVMGVEEWSYRAFMKAEHDVFALLEEMFPAAIQAKLAGKFDRFVDFRDTALNDKPYFTIEDTKLYPVAIVSRGNQAPERQKITEKKFTLTTHVETIRLYDELDRFMTGDMTIERMTEKAVDAHANSVAVQISDAIYASYSSVGTNWKYTGAYDASELNSIIENVKAVTGASRVQIYGTSTALGNVSDVVGTSDAEKEQFNGQGYFGNFRGNDMISLPQAYRVDTTTFAVNTAFLIVVPADQKIAMVLFEGEPFINLGETKNRSDKQLEIVYDRNVGVAALTSDEGTYGFYKFA